MSEYKFRVLCWNVGQASREENYAETKWDARSPQVKQLIADTDADIVALIELRDLETSTESARQFLASPEFMQHDVVHRRYCHYDLTFQMALLFKPDKFFAGDVRFHNFAQDPQNDKAVMFVDLQCKKTLRWFTVGVTHFDVDEPHKWAAVHILRQLIDAQRWPCLVYGDYNFFDDRDGSAQRDYMLQTCSDLAHPLYCNAQPLSGTFVGFPHDDFRQSFQKMSRLDHVFTPKTQGLQLHGSAKSPKLDSFELDNRSYVTYSYPSDHLALELCLEL